MHNDNCIIVAVCIIYLTNMAVLFETIILLNATPSGVNMGRHIDW